MFLDNLISTQPQTNKSQNINLYSETNILNMNKKELYIISKKFKKRGNVKGYIKYKKLYQEAVYKEINEIPYLFLDIRLKQFPAINLN